MLCETCDKREYCSELCPEAEAYVNQDYVSQRELTVPNLEYLIDYGVIRVNLEDEHKHEKPTKITPTEKKILTLLKYNVSRDEICDILNMTRDNLRWHICNLRAKH